MNDPSIDNGSDGISFTWRIKPNTDQGIAVLHNLIVIELANPHGSTVASISIPTEKINELLWPYLSIFVELQLDGTVSLDSEIRAPTLAPSMETDILQLVSQAVAPEMLEDEPEAAQMLFKFRDRLLKSLEHVEWAIASLPKD
jgi:hypothetical protein